MENFRITHIHIEANITADIAAVRAKSMQVGTKEVVEGQLPWIHKWEIPYGFYYRCNLI